MARRTLHQMLDDRRLGAGRLPADPQVRSTVIRAIKAETPDLVENAEYHVSGQAEDVGVWAEDRRAQVELRARFYGAYWDHRGPWLILQAIDQVGWYFKVSVAKVRQGAVRFDGQGLSWPLG